MKLSSFKSESRKDNLLAGTCVDKTVIVPHQYSFYRRSHQSPFRTARSGHYAVIRNGSKYEISKLQEIFSSLISFWGVVFSNDAMCLFWVFFGLLLDLVLSFSTPSGIGVV
jgi:hypothetical protein